MKTDTTQANTRQGQATFDKRITKQWFAQQLIAANKLAHTLQVENEQLISVIQAWQDWSEGKRSWPKIETNEVLRQARATL